MSRLDKLDLIDAQGRYRVPDPEVLKLADAILEAFIVMRQQYIPGRVTVPRKAHPQFYEAARLCRQQRLTAEQFVAQQLRGMAVTGSFYPMGIAKQYDHNLLGVASIEQYKAQLAIYSAQSRILTPRLLLEDDRGPLTPLFRLAMAYEIGHHDLVALLRDRARLEFLATKGTAELFPHLKGLFE